MAFCTGGQPELYSVYRDDHCFGKGKDRHHHNGRDHHNNRNDNFDNDNYGCDNNDDLSCDCDDNHCGKYCSNFRNHGDSEDYRNYQFCSVL